LFVASNLFAQLTYEHLAVEYDSPWVCGKLKLIPVRYKDKGDTQDNFLGGGLMSFEDAFKEGKISVKETSLPGGSDVSLLEVKNHSKKNIIVHSGEMVAGASRTELLQLPRLFRQVTMKIFCLCFVWRKEDGMASREHFITREVPMHHCENKLIFRNNKIKFGKKLISILQMKAYKIQHGIILIFFATHLISIQAACISSEKK